MKKKYTSYVMLGVLAMSVLLLSASPTMALSCSVLKIDSSPSGADVYIKGGQNDGIKLGNTPFCIDPKSYPSPTLLKVVKPGYNDGSGAIFNWWVPPKYTETIIYLNPITKSSPTPTPAPTSAPADNPPSVSTSHSPSSPITSDTITITALATDDKGLTKIDIYVDNTLKKTCTVSGTSNSCSYASTYPAGTHSYYATIKDTAGKTATSSTKQFSVTSPSTSPPVGISCSVLKIDSSPSGADVYIKGGQNDGIKLGNTPFCIDPRSYPSPTLLKVVKPGYYDGSGAIFNWWVPPKYTETIIYLNSLK